MTPAGQLPQPYAQSCSARHHRRNPLSRVHLTDHCTFSTMLAPHTSSLYTTPGTLRSTERGGCVIPSLLCCCTMSTPPLQVSGMRYVFNSTNPVGHRLLSASSASGAPIDPCKMYNVVTTNYVAAGGDGYNLVAEAQTLEANGAGHELVVIDMVKAHTPVRRAGKGLGKRWRLAACNGELGIGVTERIGVRLKGDC